MMCGEIWWVDFGVPFGSEPGFKRPTIIIQCDGLNTSRINTTIVVPLTTNVIAADFAGNVFLPADETGLSKDSVALGAQEGIIDKNRLVEKAGSISDYNLELVINAVNSILGK